MPTPTRHVLLLLVFRALWGACLGPGLANRSQAAEVPPLSGSEGSFGEEVGQLLFGVDILHEDAWVLVEDLEQPVQVDSVSALDMAHVWAAPSDSQFFYGIVIF